MAAPTHILTQFAQTVIHDEDLVRAACPRMENMYFDTTIYFNYLTALQHAICGVQRREALRDVWWYEVRCMRRASKHMGGPGRRAIYALVVVTQQLFTTTLFIPSIYSGNAVDRRRWQSPSPIIWGIQLRELRTRTKNDKTFCTSLVALAKRENDRRRACIYLPRNIPPELRSYILSFLCC